jgi:glutathione S-transferase
MKLYTTKATPFGRTVEMVAHELGLHEDLELVETSVAPVRENAEFQRLNPLRKIPALVTEEGALVVDSAVICEYFCARVGDSRLFARGAQDHFEVLTDYALARGIAECAVAARYEMAVRPEASRLAAWADDQTGRVEAALARFDRNPPARGRLTIADLALAAALGYLDFRYGHLEWRRRYGSLVTWLEPIAARESFRATAPG